MKLKTFALIAASSAMTLPAFAADYDLTATDTLFGTGVSNTASLSYSVNGTDIAETSNTVEFKVDRKVIFSVTDNHTGAEPVIVNAGDTATTIYTLQNDSNAPISFELPIPAEGTEYSYTIGSITTTVTSGTLAGSSDLIIPLGEGDLAGDSDLVEITVEITVPDNAESGSDITTSLVLVAVEPATNTEIGAAGVTIGDPIVATASTEAWDEDVIQTISIAGLLDDTSVTLTSDQAFIVSASDIALVKGVAILSDPINLTTNPKAIPGAIVEYTLTITNSGLIEATGVDLTDEVPTAFDLTDAYLEIYTLDGANIVPTIDVNKLTFTGLTIPAATDINEKSTYGETIIKFTVKLP
ncbi:MAG: hypothetical protein KBT75_15415 [Oleispira antarctica]|uniref:DUF11 domain-containing protein n=1 Tax=Oleispira antarctica RB-8 TaxID=698738 RepID=R4YSY2_OLEAN|nr:hypothetical protein [Oleispira antarctica]MBQ0794120.1 hypothetical protein [Oleispira antarctica]CCK76488.1 conserved hypothetical protein [Oleispira antarctica RB-8]